MSLVIPNTTVELNSAGTFYKIRPEQGYVMHDKGYDENIVDIGYDEEGNEIEVVVGVKLGFRASEASIHINRDLSPRTVSDLNGNPVTAYTEREFYTVLRSNVPENQIYSGGNNNHEVM